MYTALVSYIACLPIILPVWQEKPLPKDFLTNERKGYRSEAAKTEYQLNALKMPDQALKMQTLRLLAKLKDENAAKVMYNYLSTEKDPALRAATLSYLYQVPVLEDKKAVIEKLINNQVAEGIEAARLYTRFQGARLQKVTILTKGCAPRYQVALAQALFECGRLTPKQWIEIYQEGTYPPFRNIVLKALASSPSLNDDSLNFIEKILKEGTAIEKAAAAINLVKNQLTSRLFKQMSSDKIPLVRQGAAEGMGLVIKKEYEKTLMALSRDSDPEVRKKAIISLGHYKSEASVKALLKACSDKELLNQKAAVQSLLKISKTINIIPATAPFITGRLFASRRWAAHLLGELGAKSHAAAIAEQLQKEKNHDAKTEQLTALRKFKHKIPAKEIHKLSKDHERVRSALMYYIGAIDNEKFFPLIHQAAMKDKVGQVKWDALTAIGFNGSPWFNKTLLDVMNDLDPIIMRDYQDRVCACWAAGKIRGLSKEMYELMKLFMKQPTIPVESGPKTFDHSAVLVSILFAFVDQAKRGDSKERNYAKYAKHFVFRFTTDRRSVEFPRSYHNDYYALQGEKYLNNENVEPKKAPTKTMYWLMSPMHEENK